MPRYRGHLALTVWPIALLLLLEVVRLWPALKGASVFAAESHESWLSLAARSALVLAFLAAYARGWSSLRQEAPEGPGPYRSVGSRRLQWWAGVLAWSLVLAHVGLGWAMSLSVGPVALSHYELLRQFLSTPVVLGVYVTGIAALGLYLSQGIAASLRALGYFERPESSPWVEVGCTVLSALMMLLALNIVSHFATGRAYWMSTGPVHTPATPDGESR